MDLGAIPRPSLLIAVFLCCSATLCGATEFKAGTARIDITPHEPIWLAGDGSHAHPSEGVVHPLWAKALAIEDSRGGRVVIVTVDSAGLPRAITDFIAARVEKEYGIERSRLLFNSSGAHSGPMVRLELAASQWTPDDRRALEAYRRELSENLFSAIGGALGDLAPAQLAYAFGQAHFALNRRQTSGGPVDPSVPLLRVLSSDGKLKALLFGYACRNATLSAEFNQISVDYAGFAQIELEQAYPGAAALFLMLCGGDQEPDPNGSLEFARKHGHELAAEVKRALSGNLKPLRGPVSAAFQNIDLNFRLASRPADGAFEARQAERQIQYPIQAVRFGKGLSILAFGGEAMVDRALSAKSRYPGDLIVAGYSNDVMNWPADLHPDDPEERIAEGVRQVLHRVGIEPK